MFILQIVLVDGRLDRLRHFARTDHRTQGFTGMRLARDAGVKVCTAAWRIVPNIGASTSSEISSSASSGLWNGNRSAGAGHIAEKAVGESVP